MNKGHPLRARSGNWLDAEERTLSQRRWQLAALADVMNALDGFFSRWDRYLDAPQSAGPYRGFP